MAIVLQLGLGGVTFFAAHIVVQPPLVVVLGNSHIMSYRCISHVVYTSDQTVIDIVKMDSMRWFDGVSQHVSPIFSTFLTRSPSLEMDNECGRQGFECESSRRSRRTLTMFATPYFVIQSGALRHTLWG